MPNPNLIASPPFLTHAYLHPILLKFLQIDNLLIKSVKIAPCNSIGEGFLSLLLRLAITYKTHHTTSTISLILKSECSNSFALQIIGENGFNVMSREIKFFDEIAPKMLEILGKSSGKVIPEVIFVDRERKVFLMEDLRADNFTMADRLVGLNESHVKLSLKKISKFHAASMKILAENQSAFSGFDVGVMSRKVSTTNLGNELGYRAATKEVAKWQGFEKIAEKMAKIDLLENCFKCFDVTEGELNVLLHGDIWTTNLMFKYEGEKLIDAILIDFQFPHYGSATLDLIHFLFSSLNDEIYTPEKIEEFVRFYYENLRESLYEINFKVDNFPSLHNFMIEFHQKLSYAFFFTTTVFPVMTSDDSDNSFVTHHSTDEKSQGFRKRVMKAPRYQLIARRMLPYFDKWGILDL